MKERKKEKMVIRNVHKYKKGNMLKIKKQIKNKNKNKGNGSDTADLPSRQRAVQDLARGARRCAR